MPSDSDPFDQITSIVSRQGSSEALSFLADRFRNEHRYPELFEVLKVQIREKLGLPILFSDQTSDLNEEKNRLLEEGLLEACREVGSALVQQGKLHDGWMYLQPIGDQPYLKQLFESVEVNEENTDVLIDICLGHGIAPELGYGLILSAHGTCNSITVFDTQCVALPHESRARLATMLINHIYNELSENVIRHIEENENAAPSAGGLGQWLDSREWMFSAGGHHMDVTHLASAVRIGRFCTEPEAIQRCFELCQYGTKLSEDFQFESQPPFENTYRDHEIYFEILLGKKIEAGLDHFRAKAFSEPLETVGSAPLETYVDLLNRVGKNKDAIRISIEHLSNTEQLLGIAPRVFDIAKSTADHEILMEHFREQDDLLGFSISTLHAYSHANKSSGGQD